MKLRVLIGCEKSGVVRRAFRAVGCDAWSCDIEPADDGSAFHIQADVLSVLGDGWQLGIFHPPCTHLAVSGARYFAEKRTDGRQQAAIDFFMACINAPIPRICVENPIGIMSTVYRKPDQIVQPNWFGEDASKATAFWLKGLPRLVLDPAKRVAGRMVEWPKGSGKLVERWSNQTDGGQNKLTPSPGRSAERAKTYEGIAAAMADQWKDELREAKHNLWKYHPVKASARGRLSYAIRKKKIFPPKACTKCGTVGPVEGHHDDYTKPLEVKWLCRPCHHALHKELGQILPG